MADGPLPGDAPVPPIGLDPTGPALPLASPLPSAAMRFAGAPERRLRMQRWLEVAATVMAVLYVLVLPAQLNLTSNPRLALSDFTLPFLGMSVLAAYGLRRLVHVPLLAPLLGVAAAASMGMVVHFYRYGDMPQEILVSKGLGIFIVLGSAVVLAVAAAAHPVRLAWIAIASTAVVTLFGIIDYLLEALTSVESPFSYWFNYGYTLWRLTSLFQDPNAYGGLLVMALCLNLGLSVRPQDPTSRIRNPRPFFHLMATVILVAGIFLTFSRSAWLGAVMGLATAIGLRPRAVGKRFGLAMLVVAPLTGLAFLNSQFQRGTAFLSDRPKPLDDRVEQYAQGWEMFQERPILGSGLGSYLREYGQVIHSTFYNALVEMGIIGLAAYVWLFAAATWMSFRASRVLRGKASELGVATTAALVGLVGVSLGIDSVYQRYIWFTLALAMVCGMHLRAQRLAPRPAEPPATPPAITPSTPRP